jgi:hypothetical protein
MQHLKENYILKNSEEKQAKVTTPLRKEPGSSYDSDMKLKSDSSKPANQESKMQSPAPQSLL